MFKGQLRIKKQFEDFAKNSNKSITVSLCNGYIRHWKGFIQGPDSTPYKGGVFQIDIRLPPEYPYKPPRVKFDTKIWHPNISSQTGAQCIDITSSEYWSPALTVRTVLIVLQALLVSPDRQTFQDAVVAGEYIEDRAKFNEHAQQWVKKYASPEINEQKIKNLMEMGFSRTMVETVLSESHFDEEKTLEKLILL